MCYKCKGQKCEICSEVTGWIDIESSTSAFAAQGKAMVTKYTHAFQNWRIIILLLLQVWNKSIDIKSKIF